VIAVDTNILVYAHRRESRWHDQAKRLIADLAEGHAAWSIPWPCVYEFFSVVTNPRIWKESATRPEQATEQITAWLKSPTLEVLRETRDFLETLAPLLSGPRVRGPVVHDARIAALCLAHGVAELLTMDRDFRLFPKLTTRDPFTQ
jgi:toxin-antitoxin system PIN domain toxin